MERKRLDFSKLLAVWRETVVSTVLTPAEIGFTNGSMVFILKAKLEMKGPAKYI